MKLAALAFLLGLAAGAYAPRSGDGFGDVDYRYWSIHWRGRVIQFEISEEVTCR